MKKLKKNLKKIALEDNKTILIYGPAGVGKTTMAEAFINQKLNEKDAFLAFDIGKTIDHVPLETIEEFLKNYVLNIIADNSKRIILKCDESDGKILSNDRGETTKRLENLKNGKNITWIFTSNIGVGKKYNFLTVTDDPSLLRRFDHLEYMDYPNEKERGKIIDYYLYRYFGKKWEKCEEKERVIRKFVGKTKNYSGWEIEIMVKKAKELGDSENIEKMLEKGKSYVDKNYREGLEKRKMENNGINPNYFPNNELKHPFSPKNSLSPYII